MRRMFLRTTLCVLACCALALLAGCGGQGTPAANAPTHTPIALSTVAPGATATATSTPITSTPVPPPYAFDSTWQTAPGLLKVSDNSGVAFAPTNQQIGYACVATAQTPMLYITNDGGITWNQQANTPFSNCRAVFVDGQNASDVFVAQKMTNTSGLPYDELWRSLDGGATWRDLGGPPPIAAGVSWWQIAVVGSRLIGSLFINGEGALQNPLFMSMDDGRDWAQMARTLPNQGNQQQFFSLDTQFVTTATTIYIQGDQQSGPTGAMPLASSHTARHSHAESNGVTYYYWRSTDGGDTWTPVWSPTLLPGGIPLFVRASTGNSYYALAQVLTSVTTPSGPVSDTTLLWSADSGATWKSLPDLAGAENGYVVTATTDSGLAPNGVVFLGGEHNTQQGDLNDAGEFVLNPLDAAPTWRPLAQGGVAIIQATLTDAGLRLWGSGEYADANYLQFADVRA